MSFIQFLTLSLSFGSGHTPVCNVDDRSFFMYAFSRSESNLGRGEEADDRGGGGERRPEGECG